MHHKVIKREVLRQLKKHYPNWKHLCKKDKRQIAQQVIEEVASIHNFSDTITAPVTELTGVSGQAPVPGMMTLDEMDAYVESCESSRLFNIGKRKPHKAIKDLELKLINNLIDNDIVNQLLRYEGYSPAMREFVPSIFLRAELLKAIKFPEVSYRKFCGDDRRYEGHKESSAYIGMECKQNRAFIGLPLNRKQMISHVQMCQFRSSLSFVQLVNLMVYFFSQARKYGLFQGYGLPLRGFNRAASRKASFACISQDQRQEYTHIR